MMQKLSLIFRNSQGARYGEKWNFPQLWLLPHCVILGVHLGKFGVRNEQGARLGEFYERGCVIEAMDTLA